MFKQILSLTLSYFFIRVDWLRRNFLFLLENSGLSHNRKFREYFLHLNSGAICNIARIFRVNKKKTTFLLVSVSDNTTKSCLNWKCASAATPNFGVESLSVLKYFDSWTDHWLTILPYRTNNRNFDEIFTGSLAPCRSVH